MSSKNKFGYLVLLALAMTVGLFGCAKSDKTHDSRALTDSVIKQHTPLHESGHGSIDVPAAFEHIVDSKTVDKEVSDLETIAQGPSPSTSKLQLLAGLYVYKQDYGKARSVYRRLQDIQPGNADNLVKEGLCAILGSKPKDGFALLMKSADIIKDDPAALTALGFMFVDMSRGDEAAEISRRAYRLAPEDTNALSLVAHVKQGFADYNAAEFWYKSILKKKPNNYFAKYYLAQVYRDSGQHDKAQKTLAELSKLYPNQGWPKQQAGVDLLVQDKLKETLPFYKKAVEIEPKDALLWSELGHMHCRLANLDEAKNCYEKALSLTPALRSAAYMLMPIYALDGDNANKIKVLNSLSYKAHEQRKSVALSVISLTLKQEESTLLKQKKPDILPFLWAVNLFNGETLSINNNFEEADFAFKEAIVKSDGSALARYIYANHLLRCHRDAEAVAEFKLLTDALPENAASWSGYSLALTNLKRYPEAMRAAFNSIELRPNFRGWYSIGVIASNEGRKQEAIHALQEASRFRSYEPVFDIDLSNRLALFGQEKFSKDTLKPMLTEEPEEADVWLDVVTNFKK